MKTLKELIDLTELEELDRLATTVKNLDRTLDTIDHLLRGAVPSSDQLKSVWLASEKIGDIYNKMEAARVKK